MRGNRQGPENQGSKTGRGMGYCSGSEKPGYMTEGSLGLGRGNRGRRDGHGGGRGQGQGLRDGSGRFANPNARRNDLENK